jgi:hypothetical protein
MQEPVFTNKRLPGVAWHRYGAVQMLISAHAAAHSVSVLTIIMIHVPTLH